MNFEIISEITEIETIGCAELPSASENECFMAIDHLRRSLNGRDIYRCIPATRKVSEQCASGGLLHCNAPIGLVCAGRRDRGSLFDRRYKRFLVHRNSCRCVLPRGSFRYYFGALTLYEISQ